MKIKSSLLAATAALCSLVPMHVEARDGGFSSGGGTQYVTESDVREYEVKLTAESIEECTALSSPKAKALIDEMRKQAATKCRVVVRDYANGIVRRIAYTDYLTPDDLPNGRETRVLSWCFINLTSWCK